jgi:hypothetical protein
VKINQAIACERASNNASCKAASSKPIAREVLYLTAVGSVLDGALENSDIDECIG